MSRDSSSSPSMPPLIPMDEIIIDDDEGEEGEVTSRYAVSCRSFWR